MRIPSRGERRTAAKLRLRRSSRVRLRGMALVCSVGERASSMEERSDENVSRAVPR
jgi:hypothetical protein